MQKKVAIIGGGPAGMALATTLRPDQYQVTLYEKNKALGRKFLVAGKGGFNLTHGTPMPLFAERYTPTDFLKNSLLHFDNVQLRNWLNHIGVPTFVGTSNRVFPEKGIKPIEVLKAITKVIIENKVSIKYDHEWDGWDDAGKLIFKNQPSINPDFVVFALGGGSWKVTGSDGNWLETFQNAGITTKNFSPSNCAYQINWPASFIESHEGKPLKNISISCLDKTIKGEVVLTKFGIEGNAIYALSPEIRNEIQKTKEAIIYIDLKPTLKPEVVLAKLQEGKKKNTSEILKRILKLSSTQLGLLKHFVSKDDFLNLESLAKFIKRLPINIIGMAPLDEAISTVGGIDLGELDDQYRLIKKPNNYCIGEMLDWDAPTGGYLLQACFSMGFRLGKHLNEE